MPRPKKFKPFSMGGKWPQISGLSDNAAIVAALGFAVDGDQQPVYDVLFDGGEVVQDEVRSRAPYNPKRTKGTHLRDAVFVSEGDPSKWDGGPNILVGVSAKKAPHRHLVEYGTSKTPAKPYWRPGTRAAEEGVARTLSSGLGKIIDDVIAKAGGGAVATPTLPWSGGGYDQ